MGLDGGCMGWGWDRFSFEKLADTMMNVTKGYCKYDVIHTYTALEEGMEWGFYFPFFRRTVHFNLKI